MTYSFQNLQDFVLNLLNDQAAQAAYAADPMSALSEAGLGDLTPQDVQEVIPLVTDALPSETPLGDLRLDVTGVMDGADSFAGGVTAENDLGKLAASATQTGDGGVLLWSGSETDLLGNAAGALEVSPDGVAGATYTPLGYANVDSDGNYEIVPQDPNVVADHLGDTGDAVAGTVTHVVSSGAQSLAGTVDAGGDTLEGLLAGTPAAPAAHVVESGTDMVAEDVQDGAGMAAEQAGNLPSADSLPVQLPQVPDLPQLPDAGSLPTHLPVNDLPVDLGDLPANLPVDLPDTGAVTDVLAHNPVTDAVDASPVGGLAGTVHGVTDQLPVGDLTDDLHLGL